MTPHLPYMGRGIKRREDKRLLLGQGRYLADLKLSGMTHMAVVRSPHAHAHILRMDTDLARQHPDTLAVWTGADIPNHVKPIPCVDLTETGYAALQTLLADGKVRYQGQPVAVVVTRDPYSAEDVAELVQVDYAPLPVVLDPEQAAEPGSPLLYEDHGSNIVNTIQESVGDVEAAFAQADRIVQETFRIHRYTGIPMEPRGVLADCDPTQERITLWSATQFPHKLKFFLSQTLGIPESRIRVIAPDVGGGFGIKGQFYPEEALACLLSLQLGRPVKWVEDRREHFLSATHAREQINHMQASVLADGTITGLKLRSYTSNGGSLATLGVTPASIVSAMLRGPYRIPAFSSCCHSVVTNKTPLAVYRGAGHPQAAFCMERMVDIIAAQLGRDPADLRRQNLLTPAELPSDRGTAIVLCEPTIYDSGDYPECLERTLRLIGYQDFLTEQHRARQQGRYLGIGLCCFVEETAPGPYEFARVSVDLSGKVTLLTGSSPHGQGHVTTHSQMVADALQIPMEDVTVLHGDTAVVPEAVGTFGSRSGAIGGAAAGLAAEQVRLKALKLAAYLWQIPEDLVEWVGGKAHRKGSAEAPFTLAQLAQRATAKQTLPEGMSANLEATYHYKVPGIACANATHAAVVEVDSETGQVKVLRYAVVHDSGRIINPLIVDGQIHGGVVQGIGGTLWEDLIYDEHGQLLTTTFGDYLLPTAADVPWIQVEHLEIPTPINPYGMKGVGEGGATGAPAALVNAIQNALDPFGVHLTDDGPYTPSRVLHLIHSSPNPQGFTAFCTP